MRDKLNAAEAWPHLARVFHSTMRALAPASRPAAFFFFQAEDGIRDLTVTGVQTCALPIWGDRMNPIPQAPPGFPGRHVGSWPMDDEMGLPLVRLWCEALEDANPLYHDEIGRASCRERV